MIYVYLYLETRWQGENEMLRAFLFSESGYREMNPPSPENQACFQKYVNPTQKRILNLLPVCLQWSLINRKNYNALSSCCGSPSICPVLLQHGWHHVFEYCITHPSSRDNGGRRNISYRPFGKVSESLDRTMFSRRCFLQIFSPPSLTLSEDFFATCGACIHRRLSTAQYFSTAPLEKRLSVCLVCWLVCEGVAAVHASIDNLTVSRMFSTADRWLSVVLDVLEDSIPVSAWPLSQVHVIYYKQSHLVL